MFEFNVITVLPLRTFAVTACPSAILMRCFSGLVHCSEKGIKSGVFVSFAVAEQPVSGGEVVLPLLRPITISTNA